MPALRMPKCVNVAIAIDTASKKIIEEAFWHPHFTEFERFPWHEPNAQQEAIEEHVTKLYNEVSLQAFMPSRFLSDFVLYPKRRTIGDCLIEILRRETDVATIRGEVSIGGNESNGIRELRSPYEFHPTEWMHSGGESAAMVCIV